MQLASLCSLMTFSPSFNTRFNFLHPDRKTILSVSLRGSIMKTHSKTQKVLALNSVLIWKNKYILSFCLFVCLFVCLNWRKCWRNPTPQRNFFLRQRELSLQSKLCNLLRWCSFRAPCSAIFYESREGSFLTGAPTLPIQMGCFCFVTTWPPKLTLSLGIGLGFRVRFSLGLVSLGLWLGLGLGGEVVRVVRWSQNGYTPANAPDSSAFCVNYWVILFLNGSPAGATSFTCHI